MDLEDAGPRVNFVLHDRDASFTQAFDAVFRAAGMRVIRFAVQAPRMNSIMERRIGSCRRELLHRTLIKGPKRHQAVSGYWHTHATLDDYCRVRSCLLGARGHGIRATDAIHAALTGRPWLPTPVST